MLWAPLNFFHTFLCENFCCWYKNLFLNDQSYFHIKRVQCAYYFWRGDFFYSKIFVVKRFVTLFEISLRILWLSMKKKSSSRRAKAHNESWTVESLMRIWRLTNKNNVFFTIEWSLKMLIFFFWLLLSMSRVRECKLTVLLIPHFSFQFVLQVCTFVKEDDLRIQNCI